MFIHFSAPFDSLASEKTVVGVAGAGSCKKNNQIGQKNEQQQKPEEYYREEQCTIECILERKVSSKKSDT
jgi:hypothetical protein